MAKSMYVGVDDTARKVKKAYVGVNGVARKIKKIYVGDDDGIARLCWSGRSDRLLVRGDRLNFWTTDDGVVYDTHTVSNADNCCDIGAITYGKDKWVGIAQGISYSSGKTNIVTSSDGVTWTTILTDIPYASSNIRGNIAYGEGIYVLAQHYFSSDNVYVRLYVSYDDCLTWSLVSNQKISSSVANDYSNYYDVVYFNHKFFVKTKRRIFIFNINNGSVVYEKVISDTLQDIYVNNAKKGFIKAFNKLAYGSDYGQVVYSSDGEVWTVNNNIVSSGTSAQITLFNCGDNVFALLSWKDGSSSRGMYYKSNDLLNWTNVTASIIGGTNSYSMSLESMTDFSAIRAFDRLLFITSTSGTRVGLDSPYYRQYLIYLPDNSATPTGVMTTGNSGENTHFLLLNTEDGYYY